MFTPKLEMEITIYLSLYVPPNITLQVKPSKAAKEKNLKFKSAILPSGEVTLINPTVTYRGDTVLDLPKGFPLVDEILRDTTLPTPTFAQGNGLEEDDPAIEKEKKRIKKMCEKALGVNFNEVVLL